MPKSKLGTGKAEQLAERRLAALELRKAGLTYQQIGDRLGISANQAHLDVRREMQKLAEFSANIAEELRLLQLERMDAMLQGVWEQAKQGNVASIDRVIRIMERQSALIGLDAPKQQDIRLETLDVIIGAVTDNP